MMFKKSNLFLKIADLVRDGRLYFNSLIKSFNKAVIVNDDNWKISTAQSHVQNAQVKHPRIVQKMTEREFENFSDE